MNPYYQAHFRDLMLLEKDLRKLSNEQTIANITPSNITLPSNERAKKALKARMANTYKKFNLRLAEYRSTLINQSVFLGIFYALLVGFTVYAIVKILGPMWKRGKLSGYSFTISCVVALAFLISVGLLVYHYIEWYAFLMGNSEHPLKNLEDVNSKLINKSDSDDPLTKDSISKYLKEYNATIRMNQTLQEYDALKNVKAFFDAEDATLAMRFNRQQYRSYVNSNIDSLLKALTDSKTCMSPDNDSEDLCHVPKLKEVISTYLRKLSDAPRAVGSGSCLALAPSSTPAATSGSSSGNSNTPIAVTDKGPKQEDLQAFMVELNDQILNGSLRPKHIMQIRNDTVMYDFLKVLVQNTLGDVYNTMTVDEIIETMKNVALTYQSSNSGTTWKDWFVKKQVASKKQDADNAGKSAEVLNAMAISNISKVMSNIKMLLSAIIKDLKSADILPETATKYVDRGTYVEIMMGASLDALNKRFQRMEDTIKLFDNLDKTERVRSRGQDTNIVYNHVFWTAYGAFAIVSLIMLKRIREDLLKEFNEE